MVERKAGESEKEKECMMEGVGDSGKNNCQNKTLRSCQEIELRLIKLEDLPW